MMLKEEHRIRAMAKLGYHMQKDIDFVKAAIYQSCVDLTFNKTFVDTIIDEIFALPITTIDDEIKATLGQLLDNADDASIIEAISKLGEKTNQAN